MRTHLVAEDDTDQHKCDNCGLIHIGSELEGIKDIDQRIAPGQVVPSGECPQCGCLCYLIQDPSTNQELRFAKLIVGCGVSGLFTQANCVKVANELGMLPSEFNAILNNAKIVYHDKRTFKGIE